MQKLTIKRSHVQRVCAAVLILAGSVSVARSGAPGNPFAKGGLFFGGALLVAIGAGFLAGQVANYMSKYIEIVD